MMFGEAMPPPQEASELIHEIGVAIVQDEEYADGKWDALALVGNFKDGRKNQYGYVYLDHGKYQTYDWEARAPQSFKSLKLMRRLNDEMADATGKRWHRCLVHIKRSDMKIDIQFEYDDPDRWRVSPATVEEDALALRPE